LYADPVELSSHLADQTRKIQANYREDESPVWERLFLKAFAKGMLQIATKSATG